MSGEPRDVKMDMFKKRQGTSGISGQLYETKLISLILFRLSRDKNVEEFYLASNVDEIGAFDDVCLKLIIKNCDRPLLILIQAKHKENDDTTLDDKNELVKWCESIVKVKEKFGTKNKDDIVFSDNFNDIDCVFIVYTNAKYDVGKTISSKILESSYATFLNNLISTGPGGSQPIYMDKDVEDFSAAILKEEIPILAERLGVCLNESQSMNIMNNEYTLRYHVVLGQKVLHVSEIQEKKGLKCRVLSFRDDFFDNNDEYLTLFRKHLYEQILRNRGKIKSSKKLNEMISSFLCDPCAITLSPIIDNHITYKNEKFEFMSRRPQSDIQRLQQIHISTEMINETKEQTAKSILLDLKLSVPIAFGNIDLAIRGTLEKIEQRLDHLTKIIVELLEKSTLKESYKRVRIDDTINEGILSCNGGLGGGVGNIFIYDEYTKLLKFTNDHTLLQSNAKYLYLKLKDMNVNMEEFRFDVQTSKFPKLSFDCNNMAREFLSKLVIFAKQSNHNEVERILKKEINDSKTRTTKSVPAIRSVEAEVMYVNYHNEIQKWWMLPRSGQYLTKGYNIYYETLHRIIREQREHRMKFSLTNLKRRRFLSILKKQQSQTPSTDIKTDSSKSSNAFENTSGDTQQTNSICSSDNKESNIEIPNYANKLQTVVLDSP